MSFLTRLFSPKEPPVDPWPELTVIHDSILNQPEDWYEDRMGSFINKKMEVEIENVTRYKTLTVRVLHNGIDINQYGGRGEDYIRSAANVWVRNRQKRYANRLLQTDHNLRVQRIQEARALLESDSTKNLLTEIERNR